MYTLRRLFRTINRCSKTVWMKIKKNFLLPCFGRRERSTTSLQDDDVYVAGAVAEKKMETAPKSKLVNGPKEMKNEHAVCDREEERLRRSDDKNEDGKKKGKRVKRRGNGKSQKAIKSLRAERVRDTIEDGKRKSFDPCPSSSLEELNKKVKSFLNETTAKNTNMLIKSFMELPINKIERLENVVDLIFEKAIQEQTFAPCYAALCSALQFIQLCYTECEETSSFKLLMIKKCQSLFELDKVHQTDFVKRLYEQITSCRNPKKMKELQYKYEDYRERFRNRNCRFIEEMFNRHIIHPQIMLYCIKYLIRQHSEEHLECLCNLLKTTGKELEKWCDLNNIFDYLTDLTAMKTIPRRTGLIIQDVVDLRKNKWSPKLFDNKLGTTDEKENISGAAIGDSEYRNCRDADNNITLSQNDKVVSDGVGSGNGCKTNSYKCNRNGDITRDFKNIKRCYRCDNDGHLSHNYSKSASVPPYPNFRRKEHVRARNRRDGCAERGSGGGSSVSCNSVFHTCYKVDHLSKDCINSRDKSIVDKSIKSVLCKSSSDRCNLRKIIIPNNLTKRFLEKAQSNTYNNVETCGILAGKLSSNYLILTHLIIPKQSGTSDSCITMNEEEIFQFQDKHDLITLGWIHTHPTQTSFMSSVDLHTHYSYQLMMPEAIAIVCAPKYNKSNFFFLTPNHGLQIIADCKIVSGFHTHKTKGDIYAVAKHCVLDKKLLVNVADFR